MSVTVKSKYKLILSYPRSEEQHEQRTTKLKSKLSVQCLSLTIFWALKGLKSFTLLALPPTAQFI